MLEDIDFMDDRFYKEDDSNEITFTMNTIILCNNYQLMDMLTSEIINTVNGMAEYNDYWCDDEDVGNAKIELAFRLQRIIAINDQKITLSLEPAIIYKAEQPEDIWFFDNNKDGKVGLYPMLSFKGSHENWNSGKDNVYKTICNGQYGTYDGAWING